MNVKNKSQQHSHNHGYSRYTYENTLKFKRSSSLKVQTDMEDDIVTTSNTFQSTLRLLEHVNLNVPNHDSILPFYFSILGMGLDPRRAANIVKGSGTVWANCGASQFHLPFGEEAQVIPGSIGLVYPTLTPLKERLESMSTASSDDDNSQPFSSWSVGTDMNGKEHIRIVDRYGNIFYCRPNEGEEIKQENDDKMDLFTNAKQPLVFTTEEDLNQFSIAAETYGLPHEQAPECQGIRYVEFCIPPQTASRIAEFYECVFDTPTTVFGCDDDNDEGGGIAIVGIGTIDETTGKSSQCIIFREVESKDQIPPYDGHHIALYVGNDQADFEQAFKNCDDAGVVWVNPRFSDKATNLNTAKKLKQFRFKNIVDLKNGRTLFTLEHEVRSITHDAFPGCK